MPSFKLIIGFLIIFVITKTTTERFYYTKNQRLANLLLLIVGFIILYFGYEWRNEKYSFILGVWPNFLTGIFYPSLLVVSRFRVKNFLKNEKLSWIIFTVLIWSVYELMLIFDGRSFDINDIIATLIGSILSVPLLFSSTIFTQKKCT